MTWEWVLLRTALALHEEQISEHGGGSGVRDMGMLESAIARPENQAAYGEIDGPALAAAYAFGIARNHPFVDGNKRTAFEVSATFLILNGFVLTATEEDVVTTFLSLAAGTLSEPDLADWFRANSAAIPR